MATRKIIRYDSRSRTDTHVIRPVQMMDGSALLEWGGGAYSSTLPATASINSFNVLDGRMALAILTESGK